jgi:hypothetical protein
MPRAFAARGLTLIATIYDPAAVAASVNVLPREKNGNIVELSAGLRV